MPFTVQRSVTGHAMLTAHLSLGGFGAGRAAILSSLSLSPAPNVANAHHPCLHGRAGLTQSFLSLSGILTYLLGIGKPGFRHPRSAFLPLGRVHDLSPSL